MPILLLSGVGLLGAQVPAGTPGAGPMGPGSVPGQPVINGQTPQTRSGQTRTGQATADATDTQDARREADDKRDVGRSIVADVPTEFQRLVAETTGESLPIFGASLFNGVPSTFAPADNIPVTPEYVLGPGDQVRVQVFGQVTQQGSFTIDRNGDISFPDVGTIHLAGVPYAQLQSFLRAQLSRVFRNFEVNASMGQLRSMQVFVVGAARRPGSYTISSLSSLLNALFASGGVLPQGSLRDIQVLRNGATVAHFDLYDLLLRGDKTKDIALAPGDVIFVPPVHAQIAVAGSVNNPAIYEVLPGTTAEQAVALAGGRTGVAVGSQLRLDRVFEHAMRNILDVDLAKGQNPEVMGGDILTVAAIFDRYKDAVTLRGNVAYPGRYVWHEGMHISDLVPSKEQLITRDYFRRRNALGNFTAGYAASGGAVALGLRSTAGTVQADSATQSGNTNASSPGGNSVGAALTDSNSVFPSSTDVIISAPDIDWSYAVIERLNAQTLATALIPFNPGRLFLQGDNSQNLALESGDVVTFFSTADVKVPIEQQTRFVRLEGEFVASGVYSVMPGETLRQLLVRAGGLTQDAYLYASEFTRQSTRRLQQQRLNEYADNLEARISTHASEETSRALSDRDSAAANVAAADARQVVARLRRSIPLGRIVLPLRPDSRGVASLPDLPLEDGDRFIVPRTPSTVSVEGQVYSANSFIFERGRRERDYLRQGGGPDRDADTRRTFILRADGSVFSSQYGNVSRATMFPGDTIIVPPKLQHPSYLRGVLDFATIAGQFGLLAAALNVVLK